MLSIINQYEFALKGYLHLENVFDPSTIKQAFEVANDLKFKTSEELPKNAIPHLFGGHTFSHLHNMLECDDVFLKIMSNEELISYIKEIVPNPFRLIESILLCRKKGYGNPIHRNQFSNLRIIDGKVQSDYIAALIFLTDCGPDDGPTVVIEGSHHLKDKFPFHPVDPTWNLDNLTEEEKFVKNFKDVTQLPFKDIPGYKEIHCKAGDIILFSEDMIHGAKEVKSDKVRLVLKYGFAPYYISNLHGVEYSESLLERCDDYQKNLLSGPYYGYVFDNSTVKDSMNRNQFLNLRSTKKKAT